MSTDAKKLLGSGSMLFVSSLIVNAGNYAINLFLGRFMGPADFSEVSLLVTLMLMLSFLALAFQLTAAKFVAETSSDNHHPNLLWLHNWLNSRALKVGLGLMILMFITSFFCKDFFNSSSYLPYLIFGLGLPLYLLLSVNRGFLQGLLHYKKLALTYQTEMAVRLLVTFFLVYFGFRVNGVALGLTLSLAATWWVSQFDKKMPNAGNESLPSELVYKFLIGIVVYECSQILINNSDIVMVKHYFNPTDAGLYAALALVGRIVYFGTWTVVTLLFPIVIKLEKEGKPHIWYFVGGLGVVAILAIGIISFCYFFPDFMVNVLFGKAYLSIAPLLWKYALATALFACANVFVYYHLSLDRRLPIYLTIFAGFSQIVLIAKFHADFLQVINVQIYVMAVLFVAMCGYQVFYKKIFPKSSLSI